MSSTQRTCGDSAAHEQDSTLAREIGLSEPERTMLRHSIDLELVSLGEELQRAKSADEFQHGIDRAIVYTRLFRAAEDGRLPIDPSVLAELERWPSGMAEQVAYEQRVLEKIRAGETGYVLTGMDHHEGELYQRGYIAELEDELAACEGILAKVA